MKIKTDLKLTWLWHHPVRSRWVCMRSEVILVHVWPSIAFWPLMKNPNLWPHAYSSWLLKSHMCPETDLWPHAYSSWPHRMMSNPQINFEAVLIFIDLEQMHFCLAYKNSHWAIIDCHSPVNLQLGEDKILSFLSKIEFWTNTSYFSI